MQGSLSKLVEEGGVWAGILARSFLEREMAAVAFEQLLIDAPEGSLLLHNALALMGNQVGRHSFVIFAILGT